MRTCQGSTQEAALRIEALYSRKAPRQSGASVVTEKGPRLSGNLGLALLSRQLLGNLSRLAVFLDKPEMRILLDHRLVLGSDMPRHYCKPIRSGANFVPFPAR
jgi:hypothetical protein